LIDGNIVENDSAMLSKFILLPFKGVNFTI